MLNRLRNTGTAAVLVVDVAIATFCLAAIATAVYAMYQGKVMTAGLYVLFATVLATRKPWADFAMSFSYFVIAAASAVHGAWTWAALSAFIGGLWLVMWKRKILAR